MEQVLLRMRERRGAGDAAPYNVVSGVCVGAGVPAGPREFISSYN